MRLSLKFPDRHWKTWFAGSIVLLLATSLTAISHADSRSHEQALEAFRSGEIVSLKEVLWEIEGRFVGQILEIELDRDGERVGHIWVYELKILSPTGNVAKIEMDAKTLTILKVEGRVVEQPAKAK